MKELKTTFEQVISQLDLDSAESQLKEFQQVHGGSINDSYRLTTQNKNYFVKLNRNISYDDFFECEKLGLELLAKNSRFTIPKVYGITEFQKYKCLLMEYIYPAKAEAHFWENFGTYLAEMHQKHAEKFGLDHDNYVGSLPQSNLAHDKWTDFFIQERLSKQIELAQKKGIIEKDTILKFERLFNKMHELFPEEPASLLHGDLWSGNFSSDSEGRPCIFDPAVYYGNREMDIAMMHLFGGFDKRLFASYQNAYPLQKGWEERIDLCNLYPLMVHVNLFGESYLSRVRQVLRRFS